MSQDKGHRTERRRYIQAVLCAAGSALTGCMSPDSGSPSERTGTPARPSAEPPDSRSGRPTIASSSDSLPDIADQYQTAFNVVDAGVGADGDTAINEPLRSRLGNDTLLYFPSGRYLIDGLMDLSTVERLALVGDDATIVPPEGFTDTLFYTGDEAVMKSLHVEGLDFDFSAPETGARPFNVRVEEDLLVEDVTVEGPTRSMHFDVTGPNGQGEVRRMRLPHGGLPGEDAVGCLVGPSNRGELVFEDCTIAGFPNNGLYASPSQGKVSVRGGTYANNGIANVRVSGPSTLRDVSVRCTAAPQGFQNMRGIWIRGGRCTVNHCSVQMEQVTYSGGAIFGNWEGSVTNSRIRVDADEVPAISIKPAASSSQSGIVFDGLSIDGRAAAGDTIRVTDHDSCEFEDVFIRQTGPDRNGIHLIRSDDSVIRDTTIDVTGRPLYFENSAVETTNVRTNSPPAGEETGDLVHRSRPS